MPHTPHLRQQVGKLKFEQAYSRVMHAREPAGNWGKRRLSTPASLLLHAPNQEIVQRILSTWKREVQTRATAKNQPLAQVESELVPSLIAELEKRGQRRPTVYEHAAILALQHGIGLGKLKPLLLEMRKRERSGTKAWIGNAIRLMVAVNLNLPKKIEQLLYSNKRILSSQEIGLRALEKKRLGNNDWNKLNAALQLLEHAGLARREIPHSKPGFGEVSTYSHADHPNLPVRHQNLPLEILERLHSAEKGELPLSQLKIAGGYELSKGQPLKKRVLVLEKKGLLKLSQQVWKGKIRHTIAALTTEGRELMQEFASGGRKSFARLRQRLS